MEWWLGTIDLSVGWLVIGHFLLVSQLASQSVNSWTNQLLSQVVTRSFIHSVNLSVLFKAWFDYDLPEYLQKPVYYSLTCVLNLKQWHIILLSLLFLYMMLQVEREVIKLMEKALSLCEAENRLQENVSYMYRAATIHHRLASLYHSAYRNQVTSSVLLLFRQNNNKYSRVTLFQQAAWFWLGVYNR